MVIGSQALRLTVTSVERLEARTLRAPHVHCPFADRDRSVQVDDDASVVDPFVAGARRVSWHLDLSFPLRVGVFR